MWPAGVLFRVVALAPPALWVIRNHLQQAYPKHTTAAKGVALSKRSLHGFYWFSHLRASLLLLITDQGTASRTRPWATGAQLEKLAQWLPTLWVRSYAVCLERDIIVVTLCMCGRIQLQLSANYLTTLRVSSSSALDTQHLQITLAIWSLAENESDKQTDLTVLSKPFVLNVFHASHSTT